MITRKFFLAFQANRACSTHVTQSLNQAHVTQKTSVTEKLTTENEMLRRNGNSLNVLRSSDYAIVTVTFPSEQIVFSDCLFMKPSKRNNMETLY